MSKIEAMVEFVLPRSSIIAVILTGLAVAHLAPGRASALGIMVNEYRAGTGGPTTAKMANNDFIEFVLTENATAAELSALTFGNTVHQTNTLISVFQFDQMTLDNVLASAGQTSFLAGTIIVVKGVGLGPQNLTYDPLASNISDSDLWGIELVAGQGARDHPETVIDGVLDIDRRGTVVWVSTDNPPSNNIDTSGSIAAIGHDNNPGLIANAVTAQFGANAILPLSFPTSRTIQNLGDGTISLAALTSSTMGAANSVANQTWIEGSLRAFAVPEPSRVVLSLLAVGSALLRRRRR